MQFTFQDGCRAIKKTSTLLWQWRRLACRCNRRRLSWTIDGLISHLSCLSKKHELNAPAHGLVFDFSSGLWSYLILEKKLTTNKIAKYPRYCIEQARTHWSALCGSWRTCLYSTWPYAPVTTTWLAMLVVSYSQGMQCHLNCATCYFLQG